MIITDRYRSKQLKDQPDLLLSSFTHNTSINKHNNMKLREKILVMKWLIEFYIIVALGIICKWIIMPLHNNEWFIIMNLTLKFVFE